MINFSKLSKNSFLGKILRRILKIIPKKSVLPILQGSAKGMKWIVGSGVYGYWLGSYEMEKQKIFSRLVNKGDVVFDIGAHVGFYTLIASKKVSDKGKVYSFEPFSRNIHYLKKHIELNKLRNVKIIEKAVSNQSSKRFFESGKNSSTGKIIEEEKGEGVKTVSLDEFIKKEYISSPNIIKMDIEGEELKALKGAEQTLKDNHPIILLATHGKEVHRKCIEFLRKLGYQLESIDEKDIWETDELMAKFQ